MAGFSYPKTGENACQHQGSPAHSSLQKTQLHSRIKDLEKTVQQFASANVLATAGIRAGSGGVMVNGFMEYYREDETLGVRVHRQRQPERDALGVGRVTKDPDPDNRPAAQEPRGVPLFASRSSLLTWTPSPVTC
jgi:hypothetical protein